MKHLLAISLGPVQGFIAAARKTRDLWFGSFLLSDIARQTAKAIKENGGDLIFPGVEKDAQLKDENFSVANVILAVVDNPQDAAAKAEESAKAAWNKHVADAKKKIEGYGKNILRENWDGQVNDFVEFYAAWVPYNESDYQNNCKRVMQILSGRKACRDFTQEIPNDDRLPKSSLDGARDTVLWQGKTLEILVERKKLKAREQLDAVGVVKRFARDDSFPSLAEIAIRKLPNWKTKLGDKEYDDDDTQLQKLAEDFPYLAVIYADGDKIDATISKFKKSEEHKKFSIALAKFSQGVKEIVEEKHCGALVYAGGDEVLAFVPVDTALLCARALSEKFKKALTNYDVSLSVGVVIGHYREMLETLLDFAKQAKSNAKKPDHNGLAISMYQSGNAECAVREQWTNKLDERIIHWAELFKENIVPKKFPYDLRTLQELYKDIALSKTELADCLKKQLYTMVKSRRMYETKLQELYVAFGNIATVNDVEKLLNEMLIAQMIGEFETKAEGERK